MDLTDTVLAPPLAALAFAALAPQNDPAMSESREGSWLASHRDRNARAIADLPSAFAAWLATPPLEDQRLAALATTLALSRAETLAVALACAVEIDPMAGRALAWLQSPLGGARPMTGLVAALAGRYADSSPLGSLATGPAHASGLIAIEHDDRPYPERPLRVPLPIALALTQPAVLAWPGLTLGLPDPAALPPSLRDAAAVHARALANRTAAGTVVRSGHPREAKAAALAICTALGARALFLDTDPPAGLGPWLWLAAAIPVVCVEIAPGERRRLKAIPGWSGPVLVATGPDGAIEHAGEALPEWRVPIPSAAERVRLWHSAISDAELAALLGREHRNGCARIAELARAAHYQARLAGADRIGPAAIAAAARSGTGADLGMLAELLTEPIADEALILPASTRAELEALSARCRVRDALPDGLGPASRARYRPGVRALFVGPSGTGKTLAAGWLATRLSLPLYRVDLASVTSKYIGETEKNLAQLFARAEHAEVVLLFDEADSLFSKRTDVKDANDRFANAQTNYLLARIESFEGIAILTSNSRTRFDSAFTRRLDTIVEFPAPGPEERRALWAAHLGDAHTLGATDLNRLAASCELAGGHIRGIVLMAAVTARAQERPICEADILSAAAAEYRKLGKTAPAALTRSKCA